MPLTYVFVYVCSFYTFPVITVIYLNVLVAGHRLLLVGGRFYYVYVYHVR